MRKTKYYCDKCKKEIKKVGLQAIGLIVVIIIWTPFLILKHIVDTIFESVDKLTTAIQRAIYL